MILIENLRYHSLTIDSLVLEEGITTIIGENGSGKTSFLKLVAGIALPESGTLCIDGKDPRTTEIGWVNEFPDRNILFETVHDEVASPLRFRYMPGGETELQVATCLDKVGISSLGGRLMRELSGGEKILVSLAAAMVHTPRVLVLDEYDSHLDEQYKEKIETLLQKGSSPYVIRCTQDMEAAAQGDYLLYLKEGVIEQAGKPKTVFASLERTPFFPLSWRCTP